MDPETTALTVGAAIIDEIERRAAEKMRAQCEAIARDEAGAKEAQRMDSSQTNPEKCGYILFAEREATRIADAIAALAQDGATSVPSSCHARVAREDELREALVSLVNRLDEVHADPVYERVWTANQLHEGPYCGPTYVDALDQAKAVLLREARRP